MARTVEELILRLDADSRRLKRELGIVDRKGKATAKSLRGSFSKANAGLAGLSRAAGVAGVAIAGMAGTAGLGAAVKNSLDFADAIDKTASKLGVSTDALQEWRFAADQSGVDIRTLEMGVQRFTRRSAEAAMGTGEARDAIAQLGISLKDSNGQIRATEDLFRDAIGALSEIDAPAERLRLAFKLFDSEGAVLVNLADRFSELTDRAREMGVVIDQEAISAASDMKGQVDALAMATKADLTQALISLGPVLVKGAGFVRAMADEMSTLINRFRDVENVGLRDLNRRLEEQRRIVAFNAQEFRRVSREDFIEGDDLRLMLGLEPRTPVSRQNQTFFLENIDRAQREIAKVDRLRSAILKAREPTATPTAALGKGSESKDAEAARKAAEKEAAARAKAISQIQLEAEQQARLFSAKVQGEAAYDAATKAIELENAARQAGIDLSTEEGRVFAENFRLRQRFAQQLEDIEETGKGAFEGLQSDLANLKTAFSDTFAAMVVNGEISFKRLGDAFLQQFVSRVAQGLIFAPIFSALGGAPGILGQAFSAPGRAIGGPVAGGVEYIVGENGPERLRVPFSGGTIVPNHRLTTPRFSAAAARASSPTNITVINQVPDAQVSASEEIGPGGEKQLRLMIAQTVDENFRAGRHDKILRSRFGARPRGGII